MGKTTVVRAALLGAVSLPVLPALAQEIDAVRMSFGVEQGFEFGDNLALEDPSEGESSIATTTLSFGVVTATERQQLDFNISGALQIQNTPNTDGTETGFADPRVDLAYTLNGRDSQFTVDGTYFESDIDTLSLSDFIDRDGVVVLPEDFSNLQGTGTRASYDLGLRLQMGLEAPLGFDLSAGTSGIDYTDTNDPDLFNYNRTYAGARALFRPNDVLTGSVGLRYSTYDASDDTLTYRTRTTGDVGLEYDISPRATLTASLGLTEITTEELGLPDDTTDSPVGSIGYLLDMPDGQITVNFDADGRRERRPAHEPRLRAQQGSAGWTAVLYRGPDGPRVFQRGTDRQPEMAARPARRTDLGPAEPGRDDHERGRDGPLDPGRAQLRTVDQRCLGLRPDRVLWPDRWHRDVQLHDADRDFGDLSPCSDGRLGPEYRRQLSHARR